VVVADGLGHGEGAADASIRAIRAFKESNHLEPAEILRAMHDALRATRGAAIAVTRLHLDRGVAEFVGIGNISGAIVDGTSNRKMVSLAGIVGHEMRKVLPFTYPWTASSLLVMHSDGLSANWGLSSYPGLEQHDAAVVAAVLFRDHCRRTDDATVVVVKP
jgi:Stage II sporulation protein E (SpoIIE).